MIETNVFHSWWDIEANNWVDSSHSTVAVCKWRKNYDRKRWDASCYRLAMSGLPAVLVVLAPWCIVSTTSGPWCTAEKWSVTEVCEWLKHLLTTTIHSNVQKLVATVVITAISHSLFSYFCVADGCNISYCILYSYICHCIILWLMKIAFCWYELISCTDGPQRLQGRV